MASSLSLQWKLLTWMAPVPWDRFRLHELVPVLRNGAVPKPD